LVSGTAALAGVILAQEFGRSVKTDGLLAAYSVYLVLAIAASASRLVVLPDLARAAEQHRLGTELRAYALALTLAAVPALVLAVAFADQFSHLLVANRTSQGVATDALAWFVAAGLLQLYAALAASTLAAKDDYRIAAFAYSVGSLIALGLFLALAHSQGVIALAWGVTASGFASLTLMLVGLARKRVLEFGAASGAVDRLGRITRGAALPLSLQILFVISTRVASALGSGQATSFVFAFLIASALVAVTASSVALISSAPLTRRSVDAEQAARHVVHSSWLSLAVVVAGSGVAALAGEPLFSRILGSAYGGDTGEELGFLIAYLSPWMVASVVLTLAFPLLFVLERPRVLIPLALIAPVAHVGLALAFRELFGLAGVVVALALSTLAIVLVLVAALSLRSLWIVVAGIASATAVLGILAGLAFVPPALFLSGFAAAAVGLASYCVLLAALRPRGLRRAWAYLHALH
jgi:peptidoglycan biosynthesis protein MviN/MurJ (putative lipid II flippase)